MIYTKLLPLVAMQPLGPISDSKPSPFVLIFLQVLALVMLLSVFHLDLHFINSKGCRDFGSLSLSVFLIFSSLVFFLSVFRMFPPHFLELSFSLSCPCFLLRLSHLLSLSIHVLFGLSQPSYKIVLLFKCARPAPGMQVFPRTPAPLA